jgi:Ca2+-transporting ATPase
MGRRGSDVSREVADIVLLDDNFATIVAAIEEGRSIYENIQKFIRFFFSTDLALILLITAGLGLAFVLGIRDPAGGTFLLPLTAVQLLWINVIADGPPALALAVDHNPGLMNRPPRSPRSKLLDQASLRFVAISGSTKACVGIGFLAAMPQLGYPIEETRTAVFLYESMMQLVFAYPSRRVSVVPLPNIWIHLTVGLGMALQMLVVAIPWMRPLLGLAPLETSVFAVALAAVLLTWGIAEFSCRYAPRALSRGAPTPKRRSI